MQLGFILVLIMSIFIAIFALQNGDTVSVNMFFAKYNVSQALVILISVVLGAIVAGALGLVKKFKKAMSIKELNKKIKFLEEEKESFKEKINKLEEENKKIEVFNTDLKADIQKLEAELENKNKSVEIINNDIDDNSDELQS